MISFFQMGDSLGSKWKKTLILMGVHLVLNQKSERSLTDKSTLAIKEVWRITQQNIDSWFWSSQLVVLKDC